MRLAKHLAHSGVASRRACEVLIVQGRVSVGGQIVRDPARDVTGSEAIAVDGRLLAGFEAPAVYALNKPVGVLSTASDPQGRPTVVQMLAHESRRLYPVGRLDLDSEGLLLLTNDGQLAHLLTHPRFEVPKAYIAWVSGDPVGEPALRALRDGLVLEDGPTAPAEVRALGPDQIEITIREGRNRQVRRMCDAIGHPVTRLQRVRFGPLALGDLAQGAHRLLEAAEVQALRDAAQAPPRPARTL
ncbi:MAG TPA: pseudouridine synthase [Solirubrobacteraceae bacterium]|jgi:23S rRNA pseudouridine2605 synthase|nr:pseudouridine synthase [Solirubrobacteraceae bacterium]